MNSVPLQMVFDVANGSLFGTQSEVCIHEHKHRAVTLTWSRLHRPVTSIVLAFPASLLKVRVLRAFSHDSRL